MHNRTPRWAAILSEDVAQIRAELGNLGRAIGRQTKELKRMGNLLDGLEAQVKANTDVVSSALVLIQGLHDKLEAAGTDPAKIQALKDELAAADQKLAEAVAANTPAEETPA